MVPIAVYATIYSSNHAGQSPSTGTKQRPFPTTSRVSRKHPTPSSIPAHLSDTLLLFTRHSLLVTHHFLLLSTQHFVLSTVLWNPRIFPIPPSIPLWKTHGGFGALPPGSVNSVILKPIFTIFTVYIEKNGLFNSRLKSLTGKSFRLTARD
jgi:hypothetical protein